MSTDEPGSGARSTVPSEYVTCRPEHIDDAHVYVQRHGLAGIEVFMHDLVPRTEPLFGGESDRRALTARLRAAHVGRVHCSYWGSPTAFVANVGFRELAEQFESAALLREYYGDVSGRHMFARWCDEYELARDLGARAFVFHLIDYQHVDGAWEFAVSRETVLDAMVVLVQRLLRELEDRSLLDTGSPVIELENAGWGLEFGAQTADDFVSILERVHDRFDRVRVGWDLNHLLHATGLREGRGVFLLPESEITPAMRHLEERAAGDLGELSHAWIRQNVLDPRLARLLSALHLSDCTPKPEEYFRNGKLQGPHWVEGDRVRQGEEGLRIVLEHYDNHVVLGDGVLDPAAIRDLIADHGRGDDLMLLHELKNAPDLWSEVSRQRQRLRP